MSKTVAIVGYGYVGKVFFSYFSQKYDTVFYDPFIEGSCTKEEVNASYLAVICVPTQPNSDGSCNTDIVEDCISWIESPLILVKSTCAIGFVNEQRVKTGKRIVFSPEYAGESDYDVGPYDFNRNANKCPFIIFGGAKEDTKEMVQMCMRISGPSKRYIQTDATSASIAKYMENVFFATKVTFCYEMDQICKRFGADYNEVRQLWLEDPRINPSHTSTFDDNMECYSGKCLPKDINALVQSSKQMGYEPKFLEEVIRSNKRIGNIRREQFSQDEESEDSYVEYSAHL